MNLSEAINALESNVKIALESALEEIVKAASTDDKTPLGNALALSEAASLVGAREDQFDVVIFADVNQLKSLNDRHGHAAGDAAISLVGYQMEKLFVEQCEAKAFRRSGDEFVILLSSRFLGRFKDHVSAFASCSFQFNDQSLNTSVSFGYALREGEIGFDDLLAKAESACLKIAKPEGGGACIAWSAEIENSSFSSARGRCLDCGASFVCEVPEKSSLGIKEQMYCPCCGKPLTR